MFVFVKMGKHVTGTAYLNDRLNTISGDKTTIDTFLDRTAHSYGTEMIEVEMLNKTSWTRIAWYRDCVDW
jgi:hypothetical protein